MIAGTPGANWLQSLMTIASHASFSRFAFTNGPRCSLPTSSSPSIRNFTCSGSLPTGLHPGLDALHVREHLAFVVGRAAGIDVAVAHGRLERRADPLVERLRRLHVVVAVDQRDRLARHRRRLGVHERMTGRLDQLRRQAKLLELRGHPLGRPARFAALARIGADAGNPQQLGQIVFKRLRDATRMYCFDAGPLGGCFLVGSNGRTI